MNRRYKYLLIACLSIALVDALGSIASRQFGFNYVMIWPVSVFIYFALGFIITKLESLKIAVWLTALLGVFDATIGWKISMLLNANTGKANNHPTSQIWIITIICVALYGAIVGLISGGIAKLLNKRNGAGESNHDNA